MRFDKFALFHEVRMLWPEEVKAIKFSSDGNPDFEDSFNEIYWRLESLYDANDDWHQLAIWSYHQALDYYEKEAISKSQHLVNARAVNFIEWDAMMKSNMENLDCWKDHLKIYMDQLS